MKKLNKQDLKKAAWKGLAAGVLLASQASAHQIADVNSYANLLAANCGGGQGGAMPQTSPQNSCNVAYRNAPSSSCASQTAYNNPGTPGQQTYNNLPVQGCQSAAEAASGGRPGAKHYYTDQQGRWREGMPPAEWANQPANPSQDQRIDMGTGSNQYNQPYQTPADKRAKAVNPSQYSPQN